MKLKARLIVVTRLLLVVMITSFPWVIIANPFQGINTDSKLLSRLAQVAPVEAVNHGSTTTPWSWKLSHYSLYQSTIDIYNGDKRIKQFNIECNLEPQLEDPDSGEVSRIQKVISKHNQHGLLLVSCIHGAHSKLVQIYDPTATSLKPLFSKVGVYYAGWEIRSNQLYIYFDQPCEPQTAKCPQFEKIELKWPQNN